MTWPDLRVPEVASVLSAITVTQNQRKIPSSERSLPDDFVATTHSLLYQAFKGEEYSPVVECVTLEPRDVMFHPLWESGEYSK